MEAVGGAWPPSDLQLFPGHAVSWGGTQPRGRAARFLLAPQGSCLRTHPPAQRTLLSKDLGGA